MHPSVWRWSAALVAGAVVALWFRYRLGRVPSELWAYRDDGVITFSHARNLVDFGFVGVSPSGERVEGFSAPLQFVAFVLAYAVTGVGYERFVDAQVLLSSFALGALCFWILLLLSRRIWLAGLGTLLVAWLLLFSSTFLLWHGSGMENSLTHAAYLGTWACLLHGLERPKLSLGWCVVPLLAACSRFESILHVAPMLILFVAFHRRAFGGAQAVRFVAAIFAGWGLLFALRAAYFGHWLPNTAYAQDIRLLPRLEWLVLGRMPWSSIELGASVCQRNLGLAVLLMLPLWALAPASRAARFVGGLGLLALLAALLNVFLFDGARLDPPRTTTFLAPLGVIALVGVALTLRHIVQTLVVFLALALPPLRPFLRVDPYELCCPATQIDRTRAELARMGEAHELPRPLVACPDLGAVSFAKQFNVLDLGYLGSSVLPRLQDTESSNDYFYRIAAPDLIELHLTWIDLYQPSLLADPRFALLYRRWKPTTEGLVAGAHFWTRKSIQLGATSRERTLIDAFASTRDTALLAQEIEQCNALREPDACLYVARTVYRFLPDLDARQTAQARAQLAAIGDERQRALALALVSSRGGGDLAAAVQRYLAATR